MAVSLTITPATLPIKSLFICSITNLILMESNNGAEVFLFGCAMFRELSLDPIMNHLR